MHTPQLDEGFKNVDDFIAYSLSVNNRRKSRMGYSFEHHIAHIFDHYKLKYEREGITEAKKKPDFLFPSAEKYHDPLFPETKLMMLGAKSSLKERWRQVSSEANRIKHKHLCTLETGISINQTEEMKLSNLTLVIPKQFHRTYTTEQLKDIWSLNEFIDRVRHIQNQM